MKRKKVDLPQSAMLLVKQWNVPASKRCALHVVEMRSALDEVGAPLRRKRRMRLGARRVLSFDVIPSDVLLVVHQASDACEPIQVGFETANVRVLWNGYPALRRFTPSSVSGLVVDTFDLYVMEQWIWRRQMAWVQSA